MQDLCSHYNVDLLISDALIAKLSLDQNFELREIGLCELKGKDARLRVYTIK